MKKLYILIIISLIFSSCEDVVSVDVPTEPPRLVIDAAINWFSGTTGNEQAIKLSLSAPFFDTEIPPANGANVSIQDENNNTFNFIEDGTSGIYRNSNFAPVLNQTYELTIIYENETYRATETLLPVAEIEFIEQENEGGFSGDEIEIKAFYNDPPNIENFYFFEFTNDIPTIPTLEVYDDEFTDGNEIFAFYSDEDLESGNISTIRNFGVSERFHNFMTILLEQTSVEGGSPFETQPATVRGNCINTTNPDNFPFGYFRLSQANEFIYLVE